MKRQALALLAIGGVMGVAACGNILGLKDLEPYPDGGSTEEGGGDAQEEQSPDSPVTGDDTSTHDAPHEGTTTDAREEDGAVPGDATEEDTATDVGSDVVSSDTSTNDVVTMDVTQDTTPPMDSPTGCDGGETNCGGTCFDLTKSPHHCGSCSHDCLGGQCSNSTCQPYVFATNANAPHDMVVANGSLYWVDVGSPGNVWSCATSATMCNGGTAAAVTTSQPTRIAFDGTSCLYFTNAGNGTVGNLLIGSGSCFTNITSLGNPVGVAATGSAVFWTDTGKRQIGRIDSGGTNFLNLINVGSLPEGIVVAGTDVYWGDPGIGQVDFSPSSGSLSENNLVASSTAWAFGSAGSTFYWVDYNPAPNGDVKVYAGGSDTIVASGQDSPIRVGGDSNTVYWVNQGSTSLATGTVMTCSTSTLPCTPTKLGMGLAQPEGLAVSPTDVFWGVVGTKEIWRLVR